MYVRRHLDVHEAAALDERNWVGRSTVRRVPPKASTAQLTPTFTHSPALSLRARPVSQLGWERYEEQA